MPKIVQVEKQKTKGDVVVFNSKSKVVGSEASPPQKRDSIERLLTSPPRVEMATHEDPEIDLFLSFER